MSRANKERSSSEARPGERIDPEAQALVDRLVDEARKPGERRSLDASPRNDLSVAQAVTRGNGHLLGDDEGDAQDRAGGFVAWVKRENPTPEMMGDRVANIMRAHLADCLARRADRFDATSCGWCEVADPIVGDCPRHPRTGNEDRRNDATSCGWCEVADPIVGECPRHPRTGNEDPDDFGAGMCIRCGAEERDPKTGLGPCCSKATHRDTRRSDIEHEDECCLDCHSLTPEEGREHVIDEANVLTCRAAVNASDPKRTDAILRRALGQDVWNRMWGQPLEQLGAEVDEYVSAVRQETIEKCAARLEGLGETGAAAFLRHVPEQPIPLTPEEAEYAKKVGARVVERGRPDDVRLSEVTDAVRRWSASLRTSVAEQVDARVEEIVVEVLRLMHRADLNRPEAPPRTGAEERKAIVAWLRTLDPHGVYPLNCADMIEKGWHVGEHPQQRREREREQRKGARMADVRPGQRAIYDGGILQDSLPTGRRRVISGHLHIEMRRRDGSSWWPVCRPHEDCVDCAAMRDHEGCPNAGHPGGSDGE